MKAKIVLTFELDGATNDRMEEIVQLAATIEGLYRSLPEDEHVWAYFEVFDDIK